MLTLDTFNKQSMNTLFYYILERHRIQMKKEQGLPYPWTEDQYLRDNSFTCNRRVDDRTTRWLLNNIIRNKQLEFGDRFWRSFIFRYYNKIETAQLIKLDSPDFWELFDQSASLLNDLETDPYTRAYSTYSIKYRWKDQFPKYNWKPSSFLYLRKIAYSYDKRFPEELRGATTEQIFKWFTAVPGVGNFLGLQFTIDLLYFEEIPQNINSNRFVIAGPGAQVGLTFLFNDIASVLKEDTYEDLLKYICDNFEFLCQSFYDPGFSYKQIKEDLKDNGAYCLTDIQNIFCEYGKYRYMLNNTYKRHRKYRPNTENET